MATLLDLLSALPHEAMREGTRVGVADSQGREWTITFGKWVPRPDEVVPFQIPLPD